MKRVRLAAATRSRDGTQSGSVTSERILFRLERREAAADVVRERGRVVERARVQPDAARRKAPGLLDGGGEQMRTEPAARELVEEPEGGDLDPTPIVRAELAVPGESSPDRHH